MPSNVSVFCFRANKPTGQTAAPLYSGRHWEQSGVCSVKESPLVDCFLLFTSDKWVLPPRKSQPSPFHDRSSELLYLFPVFIKPGTLEHIVDALISVWGWFSCFAPSSEWCSAPAGHAAIEAAVMGIHLGLFSHFGLFLCVLWLKTIWRLRSACRHGHLSFKEWSLKIIFALVKQRRDFGNVILRQGLSFVQNCALRSAIVWISIIAVTLQIPGGTVISEWLTRACPGLQPVFRGVYLPSHRCMREESPLTAVWLSVSKQSHVSVIPLCHLHRSLRRWTAPRCAPTMFRCFVP